VVGTKHGRQRAWAEGGAPHRSPRRGQRQCVAAVCAQQRATVRLHQALRGKTVWGEYLSMDGEQQAEGLAVSPAPDTRRSSLDYIAAGEGGDRNGLKWTKSLLNDFKNR
jgi:hypothetical protein